VPHLSSANHGVNVPDEVLSMTQKGRKYEKS
jgi:hypothetical protein